MNKEKAVHLSLEVPWEQYHGFGSRRAASEELKKCSLSHHQVRILGQTPTVVGLERNF